MTTIFSWNVNSVNARLENLLNLIKSKQPDILLLQEIKCEEHKFPQSIFEEYGYNVAIYGQKSYNGVAILSKYRLEDINLRNFTGAESDARYIEAIITVNSHCMRVASVYVPNGQAVTSDKFLSKLLFLNDLNQYLQLNKNETFIIGGDFNVAQNEIDLYDPIGNKNSLGFHDKEREEIHKILQSNFRDTFRDLYSTKQVFSWWDYRNRFSFKSNIGWRIDYILSSNMQIVKNAGILTETREWTRPSDHAPVFCELMI